MMKFRRNGKDNSKSNNRSFTSVAADWLQH